MSRLRQFPRTLVSSSLSLAAATLFVKAVEPDDQSRAFVVSAFCCMVSTGRKRTIRRQ
jgi:hypothetical protein